MNDILKVELIIDSKNYKFVKEHKINLEDYETKVIINNKIFDCIFENHAVFVERGVPLNKTFGKIIIPGKIVDSELISLLAEHVVFDVLINEDKFKYYSNLTAKFLLINGEYKPYIEGLTFIEY